MNGSIKAFMKNKDGTKLKQFHCVNPNQPGSTLSVCNTTNIKTKLHTVDKHTNYSNNHKGHAIP